jgi:hypothetical protein
MGDRVKWWVVFVEVCLATTMDMSSDGSCPLFLEFFAEESCLRCVCEVVVVFSFLGSWRCDG